MYENWVSKPQNGFIYCETAPDSEKPMPFQTSAVPKLDLEALWV